jgi:hypothetical protein
VEPQWNAGWQVDTRNRLAGEILRRKNQQIRVASIGIVSIGDDIAFVFTGAEGQGSKNGFARCTVLETVLLDGAVFQIAFEQDIARRVTPHGGRGDNVILELPECGGVSVAMALADDSIVDARKLLKEAVAERPKSDFAADGIDDPSIERDGAWPSHQRNVVTACVAAHVDANTVTIVIGIERGIFPQAGFDCRRDLSQCICCGDDYFGWMVPIRKLASLAPVQIQTTCLNWLDGVKERSPRPFPLAGFALTTFGRATEAPLDRAESRL